MVIYFIFLSLTVTLITASAFSDFFRLKIPNIIPLSITIAFFIAYYGANAAELNHFQSLSDHIKTGAIVFVISVVLFFLNVMGGGDAKLIPAIALWVGSTGLMHFLFATALAGLPLAIIAILLKKTESGKITAKKISSYKFFAYSWIKALANQQNVVPYGMAIAVGGISTFYTLGYLS